MALIRCGGNGKNGIIPESGDYLAIQIGQMPTVNNSNSISFAADTSYIWNVTDATTITTVSTAITYCYASADGETFSSTPLEVTQSAPGDLTNVKYISLNGAAGRTLTIS